MILRENKIKYAKSKYGRVQFVYTENNENYRTVNAGWKVDVVEAFLNNVKVGYLKISYVPKKEFEKHYSSILHYLNLKGWVGLDRALKDIKTKGEKEVVIILSSYMNEYPQVADLESRGALDNVDPSWWHKKYEELYKKISERYGREYELFKEHWVDKPVVDFIDVRRDYQHGGIGFGLYIAGAMWMAERGMKLYASSLQSVEAEKAWARMIRLGLPVKKEKSRNKHIKIRTFLDFRRK